MNKTALITGGNSGIGYASAKLFKEKGYSVTITGRNKEKVKSAASKLGVDYIIADLSLFSDLKKISDKLVNSELDVLVNSAGIAHPKPIEMYSIEDFDNHINTNLRSVLFLTNYLLPALEKAQGCIINISSIITRKSSPGFGVYTATKGAVEAFTRNAALELAPKNIRVNAICPGAIDTPMFDKFGMTDEQAVEAKERTMGTIPLHRFGAPEEIAQVVLSQVESTYVTGATWNVDGGVDT